MKAMALFAGILPRLPCSVIATPRRRGVVESNPSLPALCPPSAARGPVGETHRGLGLHPRRRRGLRRGELRRPRTPTHAGLANKAGESCDPPTIGFGRNCLFEMMVFAMDASYDPQDTSGELWVRLIQKSTLGGAPFRCYHACVLGVFTRS